MVGYLGTSADGGGGEATAVVDDGRRTIRTGDYGHMDAEGYVYLHGRKDDMLKVHGNRVFPNEVASLIAEFEGVAEAAVVGGRSEGGGHRLVAFVVLRHGVARAPTKLRQECVRSLPGYMVPTELHLLDRIPRTHHGKPDRNALLALAEEEKPTIRQ